MHLKYLLFGGCCFRAYFTHNVTVSRTSGSFNVPLPAKNETRRLERVRGSNDPGFSQNAQSLSVKRVDVSGLTTITEETSIL